MTAVEKLLLKYDEDMSLRLDATINKLGNEWQNIQNFVQKSGHSIEDAIQASNITHHVVVNINLIFVAAAIVLLLFHWHPGFITIILLCWILTTLCWVLTGFDFFLYTFAEDSCSAFDDFVQNPQNNSLSPLLTCISSSHSDEILSRIGHTLHSFIAQMNTKIQQIYLAFRLHKQEDDLFGSMRICDPFTAEPNYTYVPETCTQDDIQIGDLPNVLLKFTCFSENSARACRRHGKFIPQKYYNKARAYSHSVQGMLDIYPELQSLTKCTTVKNTFSDVVKNQCKSYKFSIRLLWSWMLSLSIFMVVLVFIWVAKAWQDDGRCFSRWSIVPNPR
ncbi:Transmembrane protein [Melia azedarach]|nr:Transmembrane protein [Melia azedarach]